MMAGSSKTGAAGPPYVPWVTRSPSGTVQGELWSTDPEGWARAAEGRIRPLYDRVLEDLDLPGARLLDGGCGAGLFAELAAQRGAQVTGLDAAPGLVEYARRRRVAASFVVGDIEHVPFDDGSFDVVTALNSVLYAAQPLRALAEIARVTSAHGRAVLTVGVGPEQNESAALINFLAPHDEVPDLSTLDLASADAARDALRGVGFEAVTTSDVSFEVVFQDLDAAVAAQLPAGPVAAAVRHSGRAAVHAGLQNFFASRSRSDGTVRMGLTFRCYLAERSGLAPHDAPINERGTTS